MTSTLLSEALTCGILTACYVVLASWLFSKVWSQGTEFIATTLTFLDWAQHLLRVGTIIISSGKMVLYMSWSLGDSLRNITILIPFLLIRQSLHVHFDTTLHRWFCNVCKRNETLGVHWVARCVFNKFLQAYLLISMDVLLVVLVTADWLEFVFVLLTQFKLIESLAENAFLRYFEWLAWIVRETICPWSAHHIAACSCRRISIPVSTYVAAHHLRCYGTSHASLVSEFGVETYTYATTRSLPTRHGTVSTINIVKCFT